MVHPEKLIGNYFNNFIFKILEKFKKMKNFGKLVLICVDSPRGNEIQKMLIKFNEDDWDETPKSKNLLNEIKIKNKGNFRLICF
jgi:hypothetical protein